MKKKAFTLIEVIIAVTIFFFILVTVLSLYTRMTGIRYSLQAKTNLVMDTHDIMEKINILLKNYTIDYEEYFNRRNVWCNSAGMQLFRRDVGTWWYCNNFSAYGNQNMGNGKNQSYQTHELYHCSSWDPDFSNNPAWIVSSALAWSGEWCPQGSYQSFGEYRLQFIDVKKDVDNDPSALGDEDDTDNMRWPIAVGNTTWVQELYLISPDQTKRVLIRRILVESYDRDGDGVISGDTERRYTLQILKLKWFDAGSHHDFSVENGSGVFDGIIDTWACDAGEHFVCDWASLDSLYNGYNLPTDSWDGWTNLLDDNLTVTDWNIRIFPSKDPSYALAENEVQINPFFVISLETKLYGKIRYKRLGASINNFLFSLQTTFSTKGFYTK